MTHASSTQRIARTYGFHVCALFAESEVACDELFDGSLACTAPGV